LNCLEGAETTAPSLFLRPPDVIALTVPFENLAVCRLSSAACAGNSRDEREMGMKRLLVIVCVFSFSCCLHAQAVDATVCDILQNPASFNGKIVRVKGTVAASFDRFAIEDNSCGQHVNSIWLAYPEGTKGKAGATAVVELQPARNFAGAVDAAQRTPVQLDKSKDFKQFDSLLATPFKEASMCLGCTRYKVGATLVGRLDGVAKAGVQRDSAGKIVSWSGFGNLSAYTARLVLQSVADVTPQEIDYSKAAAATKSDFVDTTVSGDAVAAAHLNAKAFGAGNAAGDQIERAAAAFGKPGEKNGVIVTTKIANEVPKLEGSKGAQDSPDGVLYNCSFNSDRLQGDAMTRAIVHQGTLVASVRSPLSNTENDGLFEMEYRAWATTSFSAVATNQKTLTIYGGFIVWNIAWPVADRTKLLDEALKGALAGEGLVIQ
jgi:hypothetical protein